MTSIRGQILPRRRYDRGLSKKEEFGLDGLNMDGLITLRDFKKSSTRDYILLLVEEREEEVEK